MEISTKINNVNKYIGVLFILILMASCGEKRLEESVRPTHKAEQTRSEPTSLKNSLKIEIDKFHTTCME